MKVQRIFYENVSRKKNFYERLMFYLLLILIIWCGWETPLTPRGRHTGRHPKKGFTSQRSKTGSERQITDVTTSRSQEETSALNTYAGGEGTKRIFNEIYTKKLSAVYNGTIITV